MTDKRIKSYLEDRLKRLESIRNEREWTTAELGDIACCKQTLTYIDSFQEEPVSEPSKELAETYLDVFDKKFPILPTLKGKELADYKNFLNKCQQIFGLKHWGIYPTQAKLFEKFSLLWAAWGAEHLRELGKYNKEEQDITVSKDLEKAAIEAFKLIVDSDKNSFLEIFKAGAQWMKEQEIKYKHRTFLQGEKSVANYILKMIDNGWHINAIYTVCKDKLKED